MTFTKSATGPKSVLFKTKPATIILSIKGQGVLLFETKAKAVLTINNSNKTDGLIVSFSERQITVQRISNKDKFIVSVAPANSAEDALANLKATGAKGGGTKTFARGKLA